MIPNNKKGKPIKLSHREKRGCTKEELQIKMQKLIQRMENKYKYKKKKKNPNFLNKTTGTQK